MYTLVTSIDSESTWLIHWNGNAILTTVASLPASGKWKLWLPPGRKFSALHVYHIRLNSYHEKRSLTSMTFVNASIWKSTLEWWLAVFQIYVKLVEKSIVMIGNATLIIWVVIQGGRVVTRCPIIIRSKRDQGLGIWLAWRTLQMTLPWRHNEGEGVSNHQPHDCLLNRLFRQRRKKTPKFCVTGLCAGNSPATGEFPTQRASNAENVSIWWRHHEFSWGCKFADGVSIVSDLRFDLCLEFRWRLRIVDTEPSFNV